MIFLLHVSGWAWLLQSRYYFYFSVTIFNVLFIEHLSDLEIDNNRKVLISVIWLCRILHLGSYLCNMQWNSEVGYVECS